VNLTLIPSVQKLTMSIAVQAHTHFSNKVVAPVVERSKAMVCCRSLAGIGGSNSAGSMSVCLL